MFWKFSSEKVWKMCDRTSHPEKCPHARTSHALSGIGFRTHFRTHIARAKVRFYAHVRRNPTSDPFHLWTTPDPNPTPCQNMHTVPESDDEQMLGCGAHVRKIALSHVRCACGSACGKGLEMCVRKCVRMGKYQSAICDSTFWPVLTIIQLSSHLFSLKRCNFKPLSA